MIPLIERLGARLKAMPSGCWEWQGYRTPDGYGRIGEGSRGGRLLITHRVMWEIVFGPIPKGYDVCHSCDNPPCANPAHLFAGTRQENVDDMMAKGRCGDHAGEKNGRAKLTQAKAAAIRIDNRSQRTIAAAYGMSPTAIRDVRSGRTWKETG